jgi:hypothetical protein
MGVCVGVGGGGLYKKCDPNLFLKKYYTKWYLTLCNLQIKAAFADLYCLVAA